MADLSPKVFAEGFIFLEGPRWHEGELFLSDMWDHKVRRVSAAGVITDVVGVPQRPSGLGFMPDGSLLIVSMADRKVYRFDNGKLVLHADLNASVQADINDMIVDDKGRAYVGNFGYDLFSGAPQRDAELVLIEANGSHRIVADGLNFPNGMVLTDDGASLVVAETFGHRLTAFDRAADGSLKNRRVFADLGEYTPDGICLDIEGGIWVASFATGDFIRVVEGGDITDQFKVSAGKAAVACQIGGADNRTLYCMTFEGEIEDIMKGERRGRIEVVTVDIPGAGSP
jgi:sugar lactone lactonase YvrE